MKKNDRKRPSVMHSAGECCFVQIWGVLCACEYTLRALCVCVCVCVCTGSNKIYFSVSHGQNIWSPCLRDDLPPRSDVYGVPTQCETKFCMWEPEWGQGGSGPSS